MWKPILYGALAAVLLLAATLLGGYVYAERTGMLADAEVPERVVLIFESPAEDGATVAGLIAVVSGGVVSDVSPDTTVTIPGTSYNRLRDAFAFGGGTSVVAALGVSTGGEGTRFVSVPERVWRSAVEATGGVQVVVASEMTVFTGMELVTVRSGEQTLTGSQLSAVLRGLPYLSTAESDTLRRSLEREIALAVIAAKPRSEDLDTDLAAKPLSAWLQTELPRSLNSQVE